MKIDNNKRKDNNPAGLIAHQLATITEAALRAAGYDPDYFTLKVATHGAMLIKLESAHEVRIVEAIFLDDTPIPDHWQRVLKQHLKTGTPLYAS